MIASLHAPLFMAIDDRKPATVRLQPDLYAKAYDQARRLNLNRDGDPLMGPFFAWCVRTVVTLNFLSEENREFLNGMLRQLGRPWDALSVIDVLISTVRKEVRAGRLRPTFWTGQIKTLKKGEAL